MKQLNRPQLIRLTALALAALAATTPTLADVPEVEATLTVGPGMVVGERSDRSITDQYNGLHDGQTMGLVMSGEYSRQLKDGSQIKARAVDLMGDGRELQLRWKKQGDWSLSFDLGQSVHRDPNTVHTSLSGAGTAFPTVNASGVSTDTDLRIRRTSVGLALQRVLSERWQVDVSLQGEQKAGSRLSGIGMTCPTVVAPGCRVTTGIATGWAVLMLPEPILANHSQVEARVSYNGDRLKLSAGYYGSFFNNRMDVLQPSIAGGLNNPLGSLLPLSTGLQSILSQPVALAPDNQAHQFDVTGSFAFTPTTGLNFKLAQAQATQNQDFASSGLTGAPTGVTSLGGNMVTTKAQVGLTSRPIPKLALQAELRWEDRDDRTPIAAYNLEGTGKYTNRALPLTTSRGKLQASYQLPWDLRAQLGTDIESIDRGVFTATSAIWGTSALRQRTDETTVRAELRRRMSESVAGAITVSHAERDGSRWLRDNSGVGVTEVIDPYALANGLTNAIFMPNLADRQRDKAKINIEWKPIDEVSLQLVGEHGTDSFSTPSSFGVRRTGLSVYGLDWDYAITPRWSVNGYWSRSQYGLDQARPAGTMMSLDNVSANLGLGLTGKPTDAIELGASLNHVNDVTRHAQRLDNTAANDQIALLAATGGLPDIVFRQTAVKLFGKFAIDKVSAVRVDLVHQRTRWNDWAWAYNGTSFTYSDGTTLSRKTDQQATGVAMTYSYKW